MPPNRWQNKSYTIIFKSSIKPQKHSLHVVEFTASDKNKVTEQRKRCEVFQKSVEMHARKISFLERYSSNYSSFLDLDFCFFDRVELQSLAHKSCFTPPAESSLCALYIPNSSCCSMYAKHMSDNLQQRLRSTLLK